MEKIKQEINKFLNDYYRNYALEKGGDRYFDQDFFTNINIPEESFFKLITKLNTIVSKTNGKVE